MKAALKAAFVCGATIALGASAPASAADNAKAFYKGKTVTYIVATGTGGGADFYGRLATRHMERAQPGTTYIVRNVPGAGHIIGANKGNDDDRSDLTDLEVEADADRLGQDGYEVTERK